MSKGMIIFWLLTGPTWFDIAKRVELVIILVKYHIYNLNMIYEYILNMNTTLMSLGRISQYFKDLIPTRQSNFYVVVIKITSIDVDLNSKILMF